MKKQIILILSSISLVMASQSSEELRKDIIKEFDSMKQLINAKLINEDLKKDLEMKTKVKKDLEEIEFEVNLKKKTKSLSREIKFLSNRDVENQKYINQIKRKVSVLIKSKRFLESESIQKSIKEKYTSKENSQYRYFFKAIKNVSNPEANYNSLVKLEDPKLMEEFIEHFFYSIETRKVSDKYSVSKITELVAYFQLNSMSEENKKRLLVKLNILKGKYVEAFDISKSINQLNQIDKNIKDNLKIFLSKMEEHYLKELIKTNYKSIEVYNTKTKTKNWREDEKNK